MGKSAGGPPGGSEGCGNGVQEIEYLDDPAWHFLTEILFGNFEPMIIF